jgi:hypothetical protein
MFTSITNPNCQFSTELGADQSTNYFNLFGGLHLAVAMPEPFNQDSDPSEFVEASFPGYASQFFSGAANFNTVANGTIAVMQQDFQFICSGSPSPGQTIVGWWVDDGVGGWLAAGFFSSPVPVVRKGDGLNFRAQIPFGLYQSNG